MTFKRPAYEEVKIVHGGNTVSLRPSLRAACTLEAHYGFPALYKALDEQNFTIISEIILSCSSSRQDGAAFLAGIPGKPLAPFFRAVQQQLAELLIMFAPAPDPKAKPATGKGKPATWQEIYIAFYERATGWLRWTPEQAWNATPTEIDRAYQAHIEQLKAIHGSGDEKDKQEARKPDPDQAARNIAAGLDPEFDRAGLRALKAKIASGS
nr:hypothetical protein [Brucella anthropi]